MAGSSFFALFDDIATILDDVSVMTKVAAKKTAGVLGDDLALNAQQVTGVNANRELPVVWAVAKGSLVNKVILVPAALLISAFAPWAITPLLMLGGAFLCYEGVEKLAHKYLSHGDSAENHHAARADALQDQAVDMVAFERGKIKGAVRTDFILSAEIIVISLGAVADADFTRQVMVLSIIAIAMTVGVYGLVAGIVKLDDLGLYLSRKSSQALAWLGRRIVAPRLPDEDMTLSVVGTAAMFMVGGAIPTHGIAPLYRHQGAAAAVGEGGVVPALVSTVLNALFGVVAGAVALGAVGLAKRVLGQGWAAFRLPDQLSWGIPCLVVPECVRLKLAPIYVIIISTTGTRHASARAAMETRKPCSPTQHSPSTRRRPRPRHLRPGAQHRLRRAHRSALFLLHVRAAASTRPGTRWNWS